MSPIEVMEKQKVEQEKRAEEAGHNLAFSIDKELDEAGIDIAALGEVAESRERISEQGGSGGKKKRKRTTKAKTAKQVEAERLRLIESQPSVKQMTADIRLQLTRKLTGLEREEGQLKRSGLKKIMMYNDIVAKIRHINLLLSQIAEASQKALKALWLRIVHGIV